MNSVPTSFALITLCLGSPVAAATEKIECLFQSPCPEGVICIANAPISMDFTIDLNQFAPPINAREPPRNKVTRVTVGTAMFQAEPLVLSGGIRGFWAEHDGVEHLMTMQPDRTALYTTTGPVTRMIGRCNVEK